MFSRLYNKQISKDFIKQNFRYFNGAILTSKNYYGYCTSQAEKSNTSITLLSKFNNDYGVIKDVLILKDFKKEYAMIFVRCVAHRFPKSEVFVLQEYDWKNDTRTKLRAWIVDKKEEKIKEIPTDDVVCYPECGR